MEPSITYLSIKDARFACPWDKSKGSIAWQPHTTSAIETIFNLELNNLHHLHWMNDTYTATGLDFISGKLYYSNEHLPYTPRKLVPESLTRLMKWKSGFPQLDDRLKRCVAIHEGELVNLLCEKSGDKFKSPAINKRNAIE